MKQLFIMRGLPGSGKSCIAQIIAQGLQDALILSADDLRMTEDGYQFIPEHEPYVWDEFENRFNESIEDGIENIIIDNTNLRPIQYELYKESAIERGYIVHEIIVGDFNVDNAFSRCKHEVPKDKIQAMKNFFQFPI